MTGRELIIYILEKRLEDALNLKANLEKRIEKLGDNSRAETFQIQLDKVNDLIQHLQDLLKSECRVVFLYRLRRGELLHRSCKALMQENQEI